ncbi:hypothetical protein LG129_000594 [Listeria monocytogenes]|uniref:hypothetical protein n=1 Tax=Listeria monocytogenes TaxID=1639 RepID=UPI000874BEC4|nr:hypothetical protein [Listeria monocytogenes]EAC5859423.1 hypothetical protein [Listeria monocytogenes]EAD3142853.1 hypothetical protein [Listeria monocytogenes]EAD5304198.1 hypothetical protein [Listeria monocytogenes]EAD8855993.1 hypothetical protein [Listeria monocytogenes]EAE5841825.1 hypothetical protein [Listeria monocytogenes]
MSIIARELTKAEEAEIIRLKEEGEVMLETDGTPEERIEKISQYLKDHSPDFDLAEELGYILGSLYGESVREKYQWRWLFISENDLEGYAITSKEHGYTLMAHDYFMQVIVRNKPDNSKKLFELMPDMTGNKNGFRVIG